MVMMYIYVYVYHTGIDVTRKDVISSLGFLDGNVPSFSVYLLFVHFRLRPMSNE